MMKIFHLFKVRMDLIRFVTICKKSNIGSTAKQRYNVQEQHIILCASTAT